jgi:hypothetical protein
MSKKAKQFGLSKQSRRQRKRKKSPAVTEPQALVPRNRAAVVYQLFENRTEQPVRFHSSLRKIML